MGVEIAEILLFKEEEEMLTWEEMAAFYAARDAWKHGHMVEARAFLKDRELEKIYIRELEKELEAMKDYSLESARNWLFMGNIHGISGMKPIINLNAHYEGSGQDPVACMVAYKIGYRRGRNGEEICSDARGKMERGSRHHSPYSHREY